MGKPKKFKVWILTSYYDEVEVEAQNEDEAREKARVRQLDHAGGEFSEATIEKIELIA